MVQKTVLHIEDDVLNRMLCQKRLSNMNHQVYSTQTGEEAVELYKFLVAVEHFQADIGNVDYKGSVDIIISDIDLGAGIDGIEAVRQIEEMRILPAIFCSGEDKKEIERRLQDVDYPYWVMSKPASMETCMATLEQAIAWQEKQK